MSTLKYWDIATGEYKALAGPGMGVPRGGNVDDLLVKTSENDYETAWTSPSQALRPPPAVIYQSFNIGLGSRNPGTYDTNKVDFVAVTVPSIAIIQSGGTIGYGAAASTVNATLKRTSNGGTIFGTGTLNTPAAQNYAFPNFNRVINLDPGVTEGLYFTVTIGGSNNYFYPDVAATIYPR
jgi:hypothetical protein